ncbi:MAG: heme NO-binding domain-containing protein [Litoreibacter sp.]|uniref:heme NO-binding domain-containing protein n=1 Tax=Litoreibacter sp. TaxID=1969459 RepID=UPI00329963C8
MYGLIHRALQCFAQDTYGEDLWSKVVAEAGLECDAYEAMLTYPDDHLDKVLGALSIQVDKDTAQISEEIGSYLVTHSRMEPVRRLLRFGGTTYEEFVLSLEDLHDRVKLALPDLDLPRLEVDAHSKVSFRVAVNFSRTGFGSVLLGILRAMADDYGALVLLDLGSSFRNDVLTELVTVELFEADFAKGREFGLVSESVTS